MDRGAVRVSSVCPRDGPKGLCMTDASRRDDVGGDGAVGPAEVARLDTTRRQLEGPFTGPSQVVTFFLQRGLNGSGGRESSDTSEHRPCAEKDLSE